LIQKVCYFLFTFTPPFLMLFLSAFFIHFFNRFFIIKSNRFLPQKFQLFLHLKNHSKKTSKSASNFVSFFSSLSLLIYLDVIDQRNRFFLLFFVTFYNKKK
jgi:hypothetical protein